MKLIQGDCVEVMATLDENSVDTIITDPPYGLNFMGKDWDNYGDNEKFQEWTRQWAVQALRIAKPGAFMFCFGGTRTFHRIACGIEDAGWEIRDTMMYLYGSGFPKSYNIEKGMIKDEEKAKQDSEHGMRFVWKSDIQTPINPQDQQGEVLQPGVSEQGLQVQQPESSENVRVGQSSLEGWYYAETSEGKLQGCKVCEMSERILVDGEEGWLCNATSLDDGTTHWEVSVKGRSCPSHKPRSERQQDRELDVVLKQFSTQEIRKQSSVWSGFGSALKPAWEPIIVAMKPCENTYVENALKWGVAGLNIDGGRVQHDEPIKETNRQQHQGQTWNSNNTGLRSNPTNIASPSQQGRWPANIVHDGSEEAVGLFPNTGKSRISARGGTNPNPMDWGGKRTDGDIPKGHNDSGSAARFFYCAKASKAERNAGLDSTMQMCYDIDNSIGDISCQNVNTVLVTLLRKVTSGSTVKWLTAESGKRIMGLCQTDCLSTTLTEINKITESKISNLLLQPNTNAFIQGVKLEMGNGGSPAKTAGSSNQSTQIIGTYLKKVGLNTEDVKSVILELLSKASKKENWQVKGNVHSTVKPLSLMEYLVRLTSTPTGGGVLDPFMGSGTTGMACKKVGRDFIGIELDPHYFEIAEKRIASVIQQELI